MSNNLNFKSLVYVGVGIAVIAILVRQVMQMPNLANSCTFLWDIFIKLSAENQLFQMGILTLFGYVVSMFSTFIYSSVARPIIGSLKSSITIENKDKNFNAVVDYISDKLLVTARGGKNSLQATTQKKNKTERDWLKEWFGTASKEIDAFDFRPDSNTAAYNVQYKGRNLMLERFKDKPLMGGYSETPFTPETLTISVWGQDNSILKELLTDALKAQYIKETSNSLNIYVQSTLYWDGWELALSKKARAKESVVLDMDLLEVLLSDAQKFLSSGKWYSELGIPYRRGYLLYGPPGCGKTSFAQVLAGELKLDLCILNLTAEDLNDNKLATLFRDAPDRSIICLEDVDSVFVERAAADDKRSKSTNVSFSGLLNAIDGVASQEGRIFFMTTNHIEKLDPALIRPGRCDVQMELKRASKLQMERMFLRFFPGEEVLATLFSSKLPANEISMAALQGHFLKSHNSAQQCIDDTVVLLQQSKPIVVPKKSVFDHFRRVGLTKYVPIIEFHGYTNAADLARGGFTAEKMESISIDFKYDTVAKDSLKRLIADDVNFFKDCYAFAEVSTIRELFLAAYPTTYEIQHGERAPYFRRQLSVGNAIVSPTLVESSDDPVVDIKPSKVTKFSRLLSHDGMCETKENEEAVVIYPDDLTHEELDLLSFKFCEILTKNGRGTISLYCLRQLLDAFPRRPIKCVEAAAIYVRDRQPSEYIAVHMDYYQFLKRAGCAQYLHQIRGISTVTALVNKSKTGINELRLEFMNDSDLSPEDALTLAEIVTCTQSTTGSLMRFELHSRARIIREFTLFYKIGKGAKQAENGEHHDEVFNEELESLAFSYAFAVTDCYGRGLVSLIEIEKHLLLHIGEPHRALRTVSTELLRPVMPSPPPPPPAKPEPTEWVHQWLKQENEALAAYATNFINEGLGTRESLLIGDVLTDIELQTVLNVKKVGHRRLIISLHEKLLQAAQ